MNRTLTIGFSTGGEPCTFPSVDWRLEPSHVIVAVEPHTWDQAPWLKAEVLSYTCLPQ